MRKLFAIVEVKATWRRCSFPIPHCGDMHYWRRRLPSSNFTRRGGPFPRPRHKPLRRRWHLAEPRLPAGQQTRLPSPSPKGHCCPKANHKPGPAIFACPRPRIIPRLQGDHPATNPAGFIKHKVNAGKCEESNISTSLKPHLQRLFFEKKCQRPPTAM